MLGAERRAPVPLPTIPILCFPVVQSVITKLTKGIGVLGAERRALVPLHFLKEFGIPSAEHWFPDSFQRGLGYLVLSAGFQFPSYSISSLN